MKHLSFWHEAPHLAAGLKSSKTVCGRRTTRWTTDIAENECEDCRVLALDKREVLAAMRAEPDISNPSPELRARLEVSDRAWKDHYHGKDVPEW